MSDVLISETGCRVIKTCVYSDNRGYFTELYRSDMILPRFKQDNVSFSRAGVVRGMHFQKNNPQGKLVRVLSGFVIDVAIDLRVDSKSFGHAEQFILKPDTISVYIPPGFAHGFWAKEDSVFHYKCTEFYDPQSDGGINPLDDHFDFPWVDEPVIISDKDRQLPLWDYKSEFRKSRYDRKKGV